MAQGFGEGQGVSRNRPRGLVFRGCGSVEVAERPAAAARPSDCRRSETTHRVCLDSVDGQCATVDSPTGRRPHVLVVIAQMPDQVGDLIVGDRPVMRNAGDPAQRVVGVRRPRHTPRRRSHARCGSRRPAPPSRTGHRRGHGACAPAPRTGAGQVVAVPLSAVNNSSTSSNRRSSTADAYRCTRSASASRSDV